MPRTKDIKVQMYLPPEVKKELAIEAIRRKTTQGQIGAEAILAWFKFLRRWELDDRKQQKQNEEIKKLQDELEHYQNELDTLLKKRKGKKK